MKQVKFLLMLIVCAFAFASCTNDDDSAKLSKMTVQLAGGSTGVDYKTFVVTVTESRSGVKYTAQADVDGRAEFSLPFGQYNVTAEDLVDGTSTMYGANNDFTFSTSSAVCTIDLKDLQATMDKTFVLDELFFNCSSNGDWDNNYYEEYFTIRNVSDRPLYADGLSVAICGDYNCLDDEGVKSAYLAKDSIVVSQMYTIPGSGREHLVMPGESLVIAHSAIDHTQGGEKPAARDLSGADFELYVPYEYSTTTDNPEVPNMKVTYSMFQAFSWGYGGYAPMMLLRTGDENLTAYVERHLVNMKVSGSSNANQKQNYLVIPTSWIIDGVETASQDELVHKVLPVSVDKSQIYIDDYGMYGGFNGQFVKRKSANTGYVMDTNDSENDFVVVPNGQRNYPKK